MIEEMGQINQALQAVSHAAENVQAGRAVEDLDPAPFRLPAKSVTSVIRLSRILSIRGMKAGILGCPRPTGVVFLHELDDVKDHLADRTVTVDYLVYRELTLAFGDWVKEVQAVRNQYAEAPGLPTETNAFDWKDTQVTVGSDPARK